MILTQLVHPPPGALSHGQVPCPADLQTLRFDALKLRIQREQQRDGRRVGGLPLRDRLFKGLEVEIEPTPGNLTRPLERTLRGDSERQARGQSDAFLRPSEGEIQPPSVHIHRRRAQRGDTVDQKQRLR